MEERGFNRIVGNSLSIRKTLKLAQIAANSPSTVLITGASGTGKELIAQAIHDSGSRRDHPFVAINCGAIPRELIGSELFGYEGGAFTGARPQGQEGKFELADGGTIFLDEIGDMPLELQASILRVLETKEFYRVGGKVPLKADVRIIAATNRNIPEMMRHGFFREDLYYRLNVLRIHILPLRERREDIRDLAEHYAEECSQMLGKRNISLGEDAYRFMQTYSWPGNVRELKNLMERVVNIVEDGTVISDEMLELMVDPEMMVSSESSGLRSLCTDPSDRWNCTDIGHSKTKTSKTIENIENSNNNCTENLLDPGKKCYNGLENAERNFLLKAISDSDGNIAKVAEIAGISRRTVYRKCDEYGIDYNKYRQ